MTNINTISSFAYGIQSESYNTKSYQPVRDTSFDALLSTLDSSQKPGRLEGDFFGINSELQALIEALLDNIASPLNGVAPSSFAPNNFSYTPGFAATFGITGPLPEYIAHVSAGLQLTKTQQIALQDIAVNNKDATKTPETIQKIALELEQAGIGRVATPKKEAAI